MQVRDVTKRLEKEGWVLRNQVGSHRQYTHPDKPGKKVTVAAHASKDLPTGTLKSIFEQAGWDWRKR